MRLFVSCYLVLVMSCSFAWERRMASRDRVSGVIHSGSQARHWPGSELRWVAGGHVTAFVLQQPAFRQAITDSLERVAAPRPETLGDEGQSRTPCQGL